MMKKGYYGCGQQYNGCEHREPVKATTSRQYYSRGKAYNKHQCNKVLQVPVVVAYGETQELVVSESIISPPSPPAFRVVNVDAEVVITNLELIPRIIHNTCNPDGLWWAKVIVDGYIDKNINYKTIEDTTADSINGPLYHFTTRVPFSTFVEFSSCEPLCETDTVEVLEAFIEGERTTLTDPNPVAVGAPDWAITYNRISEKDIVRINLKVTRLEHVPVNYTR
ncbi:DUF3794 domain-containing protein [Clostridium sp. YIM B02505]|uniref:DUF3794 domain-containing protein n=1 Tax=Clostridium yunnanense TaxID=2800325 RepID=A0ABS1EIC7_9CLOT|nr:DUF3794 domain-containing protein [Clostridium yunnanense]MBK1809110.1 DUF3794 domain-containing protein [Clostridium yunnanense]